MEDLAKELLEMQFPIWEETTNKHLLAMFVIAQSFYKPYVNILNDEKYQLKSLEHYLQNYKEEVRKDFNKTFKNIEISNNLLDCYESMTSIFGSKLRTEYEKIKSNTK